MSEPVRGYYDANAAKELARLDGPLCRIEFASTLRLIERYFPAAGRVCDIGSGPGRYALELLRRGYRVTLLDLSSAEIRLAEERIRAEGLTADAALVGNAVDLSRLPTSSFDAGLMLGPMYHLLDAQQRSLALRELERVLKPGGVAVIAFLNSWGLMRTGLHDFPQRYRDIAALRAQLGELSFGGPLAGFTENCWSTPDAALREVRAAGFEVLGHAGVEGFASGMAVQLERLMREDPPAYANVVEVAAESSELPQFRDCTDHLHVVVRKR